MSRSLVLSAQARNTPGTATAGGQDGGMVRELHVVALSEDGRSVLLATSKKATTGGFRLKLDDKVAAALRGDLARTGESAARAMTVTPKEIQARMRAGESAEEIANAAGMPLARVERFAGPVLSERERIIEEARAAYLTRGRLGPSQLPLGDAVDSALAETPSLRTESVTWSARRLDSGHWLVQVSYVARARTRTGSWVFDPHTRSVVPADPASAALGHTGEAAPPRRAAAPLARAASPVARKRPAARKKPAARKAPAKVPAKAAPAKPKPAAKAPARKVAAKKAAAKTATRSAPKRAVAKKAPVRTASPAAAERAAAKRAAAMAAQAPPPVETPAPPVETPAPPPPPVVEPPAAEVEAVVIEAVESEAPDRPPTLRVVPAPPAELTPTPSKKRAAGERATVPDWADVLFGAAPRDRKDG